MCHYLSSWILVTVDLAPESLTLVQDSPHFIFVILIFEADLKQQAPTPLTFYSFNSFLKCDGLQRKESLGKKCIKMMFHSLCLHLSQGAIQLS